MPPVAIASLHCQAAQAEATDWAQILQLYNLLERLQPSPIVSLNWAVAIAMADSPEATQSYRRTLELVINNSERRLREV